ncbi:MAG TPA: hypothetical protein VF355_08250 [Anaerolineaceae bacterium]|jgi:hypothetical protein
MTIQEPACIYCGLGSDQVPLVFFKYHNQDYWICPQHLPILIHEPSKLAGKLPDAEKLKGGGQ